MLSMSFTDLLLPGLERGGFIPVVIGFTLGVFVLKHVSDWLHIFVTGHSRSSATRGSSKRLTSTILFIVTITLHNMSGGFAVGLGFGGGDFRNAVALMLVIGVQNMPEGFAVSVAARNAGLGSLSYAALTGVRAGAVEILLALLGVGMVGLITPLLPYAMGFAAGGILCFVNDEIIPELRSKDNKGAAILCAALGLVTMVVLNATLG